MGQASDLLKLALLGLRAILVGWAVLFIGSYLIERPILTLGTRWIGGSLWPTISVFLDFGVFAASGWLVARLHRPYQKAMLIVYIVSLLPVNVAAYTGQSVALNFPWLLRLAWNLAGDSRYLGGFIDSLVTNGLLLLCLWSSGTAGGREDKEPPLMFASQR